MQRLTITLDDELVDDFERFLARHGYRNRSEAIRDLIRARLDTEHLDQQPGGDCVANLTYVYDHQARELASRITHMQHDHHDLIASSLHVHLDHDNCLEAVILRGPIRRVQGFANIVMAETAVRHGRLHIVPVTTTETAHRHGQSGRPHRHPHVEPVS